jgi:hypothetical protein
MQIPRFVRDASPEPITVTPLQLIVARKSIQGWPSGTAKDSEDTLQFSAQSGVRPMIERFPLEKGCRSLRTNDQRPRPFSRGADHECVNARVGTGFCPLQGCVGTAAPVNLPCFAEAPSEADGVVEGSKPSATRQPPVVTATLDSL